MTKVEFLRVSLLNGSYNNTQLGKILRFVVLPCWMMNKIMLNLFSTSCIKI